MLSMMRPERPRQDEDADCSAMAMRSFFATQYEGIEASPDAAPGKRARAAYVARMSEQSSWRSRLDAEPLLEAATAGKVALYEAG